MRMAAAAFAALSLLTFAAAPAAADAAAKTFLERIYKSYLGKSSKGVDLSATRARAYFTAPVVALLERDRREAKGEVGRLDFDPFVNGQDWEVAGLHITVAEQGAGRATGTVSFSNAGQRTVVRHTLVRTSDGWRVDDIRWDGGKESLRDILARPKI